MYNILYNTINYTICLKYNIYFLKVIKCKIKVSKLYLHDLNSAILLRFIKIR